MSRKSHTIATSTVGNLITATIKRRFGLSRRIVLTLGSVACVVAALTAWNFISSAATPSSGTVSLGSPTLTYTSGPFLVSNPSGTGGAVMCSPAAAFPCDEFTLTVSGLPTLGTTHDLVITTSWPVAAEDYDIYLLQGATEIKNAASSSDPR